MPDVSYYSPRSGNIVGSDGQMYNVVDLLGGGTPVNGNLYDISQFEPRSALVIGSDNRLYDLVELLQGVQGAGVIRPEYGVYWAGGTATTCTRLGDAADMRANVYTVADGNDFDKVSPWAEMYLCNLSNSGTEVARFGDPQFSFEGAIVPYAYKLPVMVHIPAFWYKTVFRQPGREFWISPVERTGYTIHPAFADENGKRNAVCVYIAAKLGATENVDGKTMLTSNSGEWALFGVGRQVFRNYARARGDNWEQADFVTWSALQMLYLVEYANTNSQSVLGDGITSKRYNADDVATVAEKGANRIIVSNATAGYRYVGETVYIGAALGNHDATKRRTITAIDDYDGNNKAISFDGDAIDIAVGAQIWCAARPSGDADGIGQLSGHSQQSDIVNRCQVAYRGVEGFHGNAFTNIDGCNIRDYEWFVCFDPSKYADDVFDAAKGYISVGTAPEAEGYIKNFMFCDNAPFAMIPGDSGGSSTSYIPDYYYRNTGNCAPRVGGYASHGAYAGAWSWNASYAASSGHGIFGGRLRYKKPI